MFGLSVLPLWSLRYSVVQTKQVKAESTSCIIMLWQSNKMCCVRYFMSQTESVTPACWVSWQTSAPLPLPLTKPRGRCSGGTPRESSAWSSSSSAPSTPGRFSAADHNAYDVLRFWALTLSIPLLVSVRPATPRWTSWCRRKREGRPKRAWWERTACAEPWTTRRTESLTATPFSTSIFVWLLSTSWWLSPTGTSKWISQLMIVFLLKYIGKQCDNIVLPKM